MPIAQQANAMRTPSDEWPNCVRPTTNASEAATTPNAVRRGSDVSEFAIKAPTNEPPAKNVIASADGAASAKSPCPAR